jgi:hypothetical protein
MRPGSMGASAMRTAEHERIAALLSRLRPTGAVVAEGAACRSVPSAWIRHRQSSAHWNGAWQPGRSGPMRRETTWHFRRRYRGGPSVPRRPRSRPGMQLSVAHSGLARVQHSGTVPELPPPPDK